MHKHCSQAVQAVQPTELSQQRDTCHNTVLLHADAAALVAPLLPCTQPRCITRLRKTLQSLIDHLSTPTYPAKLTLRVHHDAHQMQPYCQNHFFSSNAEHKWHTIQPSCGCHGSSNSGAPTGPLNRAPGAASQKTACWHLARLITPATCETPNKAHAEPCAGCA